MAPTWLDDPEKKFQSKFGWHDRPIRLGQILTSTPPMRHLEFGNGIITREFIHISFIQLNFHLKTIH